ncbi:hypothetical protein AaE_009644, partial [Aphanomyces astaci]
PPLVLDLVEMTHNVQFVNVNATALLLDQFATWTLQTTEEVLDVTLYFRVATTQPHHEPTSTNDVVLAVQLHVLQTADVREVSVTPVVGGAIHMTTTKSYQDTGGLSPLVVNVQLPHVDPPTYAILPNPECDYLVQQCQGSAECVDHYNCMPYLVFSQLLLDDESTASAGTKSDLTETVLACFDASYDATWQVHAAAIQCALSRPHYLHHTSTLMTTFQQPTKPRQRWQLIALATLTLTMTLQDSSVVLVIDQTSDESALATLVYDLVMPVASAQQQ